MDQATELRARARRWRELATVTRAEVRALRALAAMPWRGSSADAFRRVLTRRLAELSALAEREEGVADMLERLASVVERAA